MQFRRGRGGVSVFVHTQYLPCPSIFFPDITDPNSELVHSKYCPSLATAESIHKILSKDWDFFVALFDEAGEGKLGKRPYWIDHTHQTFIMPYVHLYYYDSGYDYGSKSLDGDSAPILVKMDYWISDTGFNDGGTY